jgi:hypothetical protein
VGGRVSRVNHELTYHLDVLAQRPFATSWICCLVPDNLSEDLARLKVGADSGSWYHNEIDLFRTAADEMRGETAPATEAEAAEEEESESRWSAFTRCFLKAEKPVAV